jgi:quercetin dioxygenase-like cupin family protein
MSDQPPTADSKRTDEICAPPGNRRVIRAGDGHSYAPPGHHKMICAWLFGDGKIFDSFVRLAKLDYEPGACVDPAASPFAKIYFCLQGEIEVEADDGLITLSAGDAWLVSAGTERRMMNRTDSTASALLLMPPLI